MPVPSPQYVRDLSLTGEFNALTDAQINNVISDEVTYMYESITSEDFYTRLVGLHTAHILKTALLMEGGQGGLQGALTSAKVGQLEKRWGQGQKPVEPGDGLDATTEYGRRALRLLRSWRPAVRATY